MSDDLVRRIHEVRFTPVRIREGYDVGEVDLLLDELEQALVGGHPVDPLIDAARFTPVRMREGYVTGEVDDFLEEVRVAAAARSTASRSTAPRPDPEGSDDADTAAARREAPSRPTRSDHPSVIEERPGLLSRIFGGRS